MIKKTDGFTLIELLVVIAIIAILTALLMANFIGIRERGRDAQRKSDLRQIQTALELYRSDNGEYPDEVPNCTGDNSLQESSACDDSTVYMKTVPKDPLGTAMSYQSGSYYYDSAGDNSTYTLAACLENRNDQEQYSTTSSPGGSGTCASGLYYVLTNP